MPAAAAAAAAAVASASSSSSSSFPSPSPSSIRRRPRRRTRRGIWCWGEGSPVLLPPSNSSIILRLLLLLLPLAAAVTLSWSAFSSAGHRSPPTAPPPDSTAFPFAAKAERDGAGDPSFPPPPLLPEDAHSPPALASSSSFFFFCKGAEKQKGHAEVKGGGGGGGEFLIPNLHHSTTAAAAAAPNGGPYHNRELFTADFEEMRSSLRIFVYPDVSAFSSPFANVFLPHRDPLLLLDPKLGNYYSEHMFKHSLLRSSLVTLDPREAQLFFMPFSINDLRNDPRVRSEPAIADFVAGYARRITREFGFWNRSGGSDHFYVCCHSVGRDAASKHRGLRENAVQVTCSSSYFQRTFVAHKDVALPQVWPRPPERSPNPPEARKRLVFFAGRIKNSRVRGELIAMWENDTCMDIFSRSPPFPYEEGFRRSRYCLHVKGYEVNTARISDAIHYGCIPVILSNHYDLPFANVLDWSKFSIVVNHGDGIGLLKKVLISIPDHLYLTMYQNLLQVRKHFRWHTTPKGYDSFHMTAYQLWLKRLTHLHANY